MTARRQRAQKRHCPGDLVVRSFRPFTAKGQPPAKKQWDILRFLNYAWGCPTFETAESGFATAAAAERRAVQLRLQKHEDAQ